MPFEALHERLLKGGIAPRHVRRYLGELEDHLVELIRCEEDAGYAPAEAAARASATLGDDALLAEAMLSQPKLRSISARFPWLVFGVVPPFAVMASFLLPFLLLLAIGKAAGAITEHGMSNSDWYRTAVQGLALLLDLTVAPLAAALLVSLAQHQRLNRLWPMFAIVLLSVLFIHMEAHFANPHGPGSIQIGMGSWLHLGVSKGPRHQAWLSDPWSLRAAQLALTLAPALWLTRAFQRRVEI